MKSHLSKTELEQIIQKTPQHLETKRFLHYEKCSYCQNQYKQQSSVHGMLLSLKPLKASNAVIGNVVEAVTKISSMPAKKTDWLFLVASIILFGIGAWFVFNNNFTDNLGSSITTFLTEPNTYNSISPMLDNVKENIKGIGFSFDLIKINGYSHYLVFGFLSIILYVFLDKKIGQVYKTK